MKIGVNARFLTKPYTGIGQYTDFLFRELVKGKDEYLLMVPEAVGLYGTCVLPEIGIGSAGMRKTYWEQISVPQFLKKERVDLVHFPYPCNPWYPCKVPQVVTIHDTIPWDFPEYRYGLLSALYHAQTRRAAKRADKIITVSKASKKDIVRSLKVMASKVEVIYNAASPIFSHEVSNSRRDEVLKKHGLDKPYFLYVGGYDKRKNVNLLLELFDKHIAEKHDLNLVLIGGKLHDSALYGSFDALTAGNLKTRIDLSRGGVKRLGFLPDEELAVIYRSSLCFLHLSEKEGFNIPIVEAAESGTAILLSDTDVHREIAGKCAEYLDLEDPESIAKTLARVASDKEYRNKLALRATKLRGKYTWQKAAKQTFALYKSLL